MLKVLDWSEDFWWFYVFFNSKCEHEMSSVGWKLGLFKDTYDKLACLIASNQFVDFFLILEVVGSVLKYWYSCVLF